MKPLYTATILAIATSQAIAASSNPKLEEMVVTSSRVPMPLRQVGTSVSVVDSQDIEIRGFTSLASVLRYEPGINVTNNGGIGKATELGIRGERGFRTKVYIDGMDVTDTSTPQAGPNFAHLNSTGIERVEILRGPQGMMYGADAGGIVNISTRKAMKGNHGEVNAEYGRYDTYELNGSLSTATEQADAILLVSRFKTDGFNTLTTDPDPQDEDGYKNTTIHARAGWNISDTLRAEVVGRDVEGKNEYDSCSVPVTFDPSDDCTNDSDQQSWRLSLQQKGAQFANQLAYNQHSSEREFFTAGESSFATEGELKKLEYLGSWTPSTASSLVYGVELLDEAIKTQGETSGRDQNAVFAEYQANYMDQLYVTAGARYDDNDDFGNETTYRLSLAYLVDIEVGEIKLRSSYGTGFRAPSLSEIAYNAGPNAYPPASNIELTAERSEGWEAAVTYYANDGWWVDLVYFDQTIEDQISFDLGSFSGYLQGDGDSFSKGIELIGEFPINEQVSLTANYTYNDSESADGIQRIRAPKHSTNVGVQVTPLDGKLIVNLNARFARDIQDERSGPVDDFDVVDLGANYKVTPQLDVYGRIENLLDEDYEEIPTYETSGRAGYVGVRYHF